MPDYQHSGKSANRTVNKEGKIHRKGGSPRSTHHGRDLSRDATNPIKQGVDRSEVTPGATPQSANKSFRT